MVKKSEKEKRMHLMIRYIREIQIALSTIEQEIHLMVDEERKKSK